MMHLKLDDMDDYILVALSARYEDEFYDLMMDADLFFKCVGDEGDEGDLLFEVDKDAYELLREYSDEE